MRHIVHFPRGFVDQQAQHLALRRKVNQRELDRLIGAVERKGYTLVPLNLHWRNGRVKLDIGLAKGKKSHDKRAAIKDRDWKRQQARILKGS